MNFSKSTAPVSRISALARSSSCLPSASLVAGCRSEQQISANNTGEAFRNPGMTLGRNLDCLINRGESSRIIAIQSVGICQISQNTGFVFQTGLSRSSEAESVGQIFNRRGESSCDDMRKTTTGLGIDSQIGVAAFYGEGKRSVGMLLSQSDVSLCPRKVDIRQARYDVMENVNLATLQLNDAIEEWAGFILFDRASPTFGRASQLAKSRHRNLAFVGRILRSRVPLPLPQYSSEALQP